MISNDLASMPHLWERLGSEKWNVSVTHKYQ
jgi:hypothetical protein